DGQGEDAGTLDDNERARWRRQALAWLRADLARLTQPGAGLPSSEAMRKALRSWQQDKDLASLRDPAALSKLSAAEQAEITRFWADVRSVVNQAELKGDLSNTEVAMRVMALHAWFGREKEYDALRLRLLESAQETKVAGTAERVAKAC